MLTTVPTTFWQLPCAHVLLARLCRECSEAIPTKRLLAVPNTTICTCCLAKRGDVPRIRRFDEMKRDGELVETYFTRDHYIEQQLQHTNANGPKALRGDSQRDQAVTAATDLHTAVCDQRISERTEA